MGFGQWQADAADWLDAHINPFHNMFGPSLNEQKKLEQGKLTPAQVTPGLAVGPTEKVLSGMAWLRDNVISHPLTTLTLMARKSMGDWSTLPETLPTFTDPNEWSKSWAASKHISPAQAIAFDSGQGSDADNARALENAPLEYKRPENLPADFNQLPWQQQQDLLKNAGMPVQGNALVEQQRRASAFYKYGTGAGDFVLAWKLDPNVLIPRAVGAAKAEAIRRPVDATWTGARIDEEMNRSLMRQTQDFIFSNKDNPQLLNNLPIAKNSAMGPRFGAIASTLKDPEEVNLFLRVGMGDTRAMEELGARNKQAAQILESDTSRLPALDLMHSRYGNNTHMQGLIEREMQRVNERINANVDMVGRYQQILDHAHEIDELAMTRWSFARAEAATEAQNAYTAGAARKAGGNIQPLTSITPVVGRVPRAPGERLVGFTDQTALQRPITDALPGGAGHVSTRIYGNFFATPLTVIRSFGEYRPNGHINLQTITQEGINEIRGYVARIPGMTGADRNRVINSWLSSASEGDRMNIVQGLERQAMRSIAERHGFTAEEGEALLNAHRAKLAAEKTAMRSESIYSTVKVPGAEPGEQLRVDVFPDGHGGYKVHPNLVTRLINDTQMIDLNTYDKILSRHGSALKALRVPGGDAADWVAASGDWLNTAWKFGTLFRLGYIPRVLGDDIGGQIARLGAAQMALRVGWGIKNGATNVARSWARPFMQAEQEANRQGIAYTSSELKDLGQNIKYLEELDTRLFASNRRDLAVAQRRHDAAQAKLAATAPVHDPFEPGFHKYQAAVKFADMRAGALRQAQGRLNTGLSIGKLRGLNAMQARRDFLERYQSLAERRIVDLEEAQQKVIQGVLPVDAAPGLRVPGAFSGERGQMYQELISSEASVDAIFRSNKRIIHGNLMRSWDHGAVAVNATQDPAGHLAAWTHVINAQFGNDAMARLALEGKSVREIETWLLRNPEGIAYRQRLGENLTSAEDLARRVHYDVNEIAPTAEIRAAALTPEGVLAEQLEREFPNLATRPDVHRGQLAANLEGGNQYRQGMNKIIDGWYKWAAAIPADRMSRHPLFNQLYEGHAKRISAQEIGQGRTLTTARDAERIAEAARRLALRDTRKLVFDIAHRSDAAAALKWISPFFSATTESWQRWARIIAERPEVAGYGAKFFNTPLALGVVQDKDGNGVDAEGYVYDPVLKQRRLVPKGDRRIVMRLPKFMVEGHNPIGLALGASPAGDINLSQDSMNLVLSGDPWFNPGQGPIVTIPLNEFVRDKPELAELAQHIGTLPFGPATNETFVGRAASQLLPRTVKDFLTAYDTSDSRYQGIKAQIMQRAAFEHANLGKPMPSAQEIADRTRNYWLFAAASAFLGPVSGQGSDPYQFYRDEYNKMVRSAQNNPRDQFGRMVGQSADDMFLEKYGESYFVFAQTMSKNLSGLPATMNAVRLQKQYQGLIDQAPELAALIVGPEGNGPFSPAAYAYQLNNPLTPGGAEMQRRRLSADEAMTENQKRLGWAKYTARMNDLNAQLVRRGLASFNDSGAEDLKMQKQNWTSLYSKPLYPDGTNNPYYIKAWADDYNTYDAQKYNALIPALTEIARSPLAKDRTDLHVLQEYLGARQELSGILADRKRNGGAGTLTARQNEDLRDQWERTVQRLVLGNTSFGDLFHRYLSRDMQVDVLQQLEQEGVITSGSAG